MAPIAAWNNIPKGYQVGNAAREARFLKESFSAYVSLNLTRATIIFKRRGDVEKKCVWRDGKPCKGEVKERPVFNGQFKAMICEQHLDNHEKWLLKVKPIYDNLTWWK